MCARRAELGAGRTPESVRKAHRNLLGGRGGKNLVKLLSLSWGVAAVIACNTQYSLADIEVIWGAVPGMGCLSGTGFALKEPAQDLALALAQVGAAALPDDWNTWTPLGPGCRKALLRLGYCGAVTERQWDLFMSAPRGTRAEQDMIESLRCLTTDLEETWPEDIPLPCKLRVHHTQWQLCEFTGYAACRDAVLGRGPPPAYRRCYPRAVLEWPS